MQNINLLSFPSTDRWVTAQLSYTEYRLNFCGNAKGSCIDLLYYY